MVNIKSEKIYKQIRHELSNMITPKTLSDFCSQYGYSFCILKYNEDGLYLKSGENECRLDFLGEMIEGHGVFEKYNNYEDNEELYKELDIFLTNIDNGEYDIIYANSPDIKVNI